MRYFILTFSPKNAKELYNLRHASLRNAIERIFGVMKKRFKILKVQVEYPFEIQVRLIKVLCCLHNIIRIAGGDDAFDELWKKDLARILPPTASTQNDGVLSKAISPAQVRLANSMRDGIAEKMWAQYSKRGQRTR